MTRRYPCTVVKNYDGDTLTVILDMGFLISHKVQLRLSAIDTPELRGGTILTRAFGRYIRDVVAERVERAESVVFVCEAERDKYGRALGDLIVDDLSLQHWLVDQELAVPYQGESRSGLLALHKINAAKHRRKGAFKT